MTLVALVALSPRLAYKIGFWPAVQQRLSAPKTALFEWLLCVAAPPSSPPVYLLKALSEGLVKSSPIYGRLNYAYVTDNSPNSRVSEV